MKLVPSAVALLLVLVSMADGKTPKSRFIGNWESLDTDNRKFEIAETKDGWEMTAPDLSCTIKGEAQDTDVDTTIAITESECSDEGTTTRSTGQMKLFKEDNFLVMVGRVHHRRTEGKNETLKEPEMFVYLYRRMKCLSPTRRRSALGSRGMV
jgi:hypothetical protein